MQHYWTGTATASLLLAPVLCPASLNGALQGKNPQSMNLYMNGEHKAACESWLKVSRKRIN